MSKPLNPLEHRTGYSTYFVLAAFKTTPEAEVAELKLDDGPEGANVDGGVLIVNDSIEPDKAPTRFFISGFNYDFSWASNENDSTVSGGNIIIADSSGGEFLNFLRQEVISTLDTSLENITFALRIFWVQSGETTGSDIIKSEKLYFSISEVAHKIAGHRHFYDCSIISLYNAKANSTNYNRVYGMSITHKDGELHDEIPIPKPSGGGIKPRSEENADKNPERNIRLEKSKPMLNLGEAYQAFQKELNESTKPHQGQYQEWQKVIRDDYVKKLDKPNPKKDIPISYSILLGETYEEYNIDNRNLPFEQPDQTQGSGGVRVIPTEYGEKLDSVVDRIMEYSRQVGIDAKNPSEPKDYKVCKVWRRAGNTILYNIVVDQYTVPVNFANGMNTGPGEGALDPFTYYFKIDSEEQPDDVMMFDGILHRSDALRIMETVQDEDLARLAYGAEREGISSEREPNTDFFKTGYSGHRPKISNQKVLGVEYPNELAESIQRKYATQNVQQSTIEITIPGNPEFLSDLFRSPKDVAAGVNGKATHYARPEVYPMYAKIIVQFSSSESSNESTFYHENWMHIYKVETSIVSGTFFHKLTLLRTDEVI